MKNCQILGYGKYTEKETNNEMIRIVVGIDSTSENYTGTMVTTAFLEYSKDLEDELNYAIKTGAAASYQTTDNIITGKTKINKIIVNH